MSHLTPDPGILPDVLYVEELPADLLAFTLDKTGGAFSATTRYRDYAISRDLIHWESQSVTRAAGGSVSVAGGGVGEDYPPGH